jgi:2'-5' RNA ligase
MNEKSQTGMISLLPMTSEWCKQEFPHLTLVYLGDISQTKQFVFMSIAKSVASMSMLSNPINLKTDGVEILGGQDSENPPVDVLRFSPSQELLAMRNFFEDLDSSEFTIFKPHVTLGPAGSFKETPPLMVIFDRIAISWADTTLPFWLRRY